MAMTKILRAFHFCVLLVVTSFMHSQPAYAQNTLSSVLQTDFAELRLVSALNAQNTPNSQDIIDPVPMGLEVLLRPGWKIYWRSPGDAGLPPRLFNAVDETEIALSFPAPKRFSLFGLDTFGYSDKIIFPFDLPADAFDGAGQFYGRLEALICSDICVPVSGEMLFQLPAGEARPSIEAQQIAYARSQIPTGATGPDIGFSHISYLANSQQLDIALSLGGLTLDDVLIETDLQGYSFAKPVASAETGRYLIDINGPSPEKLIGTKATLTILAAPQMKEVAAVIAPAPPVATSAQSASAQIASSPVAGGLTASISLGLMGIAFLGGLILNLMPCVLPVLSLKITSLLSVSALPLSVARRRLLSSAAGILTSFALLALALIMVRSAGYALGWGIQFQQPVFLGVMALVLGLFTLSLFDKLVLPVPQFAARLSRTANGPYINDFLSGMLATLLATPCSAPFVGTAVSFAFSAPDEVMVGTLMVMGLGLASPWLMLALLPQLVWLLPKPGAWMNRVKQLMGLFLLGTLIWVLWLFVGAIEGRSKAGEAVPASGWSVYSPAAFEAAQADGRVILLDVTADWCITCQANKKLVLETADIEALLAAENVLKMQADWTLPDDDIADLLSQYNRFGIPFNLISAPTLETPILLPELLTKDVVRGALAQTSTR